MLNDETFADEVCAEHRSIAQAILDAIKAVLKKLRIMLADGESFTPKQNAGLLSQLDILKECEKIWTDGLAKASENRYAVGVAAAEKSAERIKHFKITKDDVIDNMRAISKMDYVKTLTGNEFAKGDIDLITQVETFFDSIGGFAENDVIGEVELNRKGAKSSIGHGVGRNKAIAFKAIPEIIANGKIIDAQHNRRDRGYDTVVLAAPIQIGKVPYYAGVIVVRDLSVDKQSYYLHEVGIIKRNSTPSKTAATQKGSTRGGETASLINLLQQINDVNSLSANDILSHEGKFSLGYHAGDLGKSESLFQQSGGRSTGHFGTGTYFVGNKEKIKGYNMRDGKEAPVEEVEFSNYNLYKPEDTRAAYKLHDFLKGVNEYYKRYGFGTLDEDGVQAVRDEADDILYRMDAGETEDIEARMFLSRVTGEDYIEDSYDDVREALWNVADERSRETARLEKVAEFNENIPEMCRVFGISENEMLEKLDAVREELEDVNDYESRRVHDSASTVFMKSLGYEGIDVRHTDLDNTMYGSVIYDLKGGDSERKAEIGTARFAVSEPLTNKEKADAMYKPHAGSVEDITNAPGVGVRFSTGENGTFFGTGIKPNTTSMNPTGAAVGKQRMLTGQEMLKQAIRNNTEKGGDWETPFLNVVNFVKDMNDFFINAGAKYKFIGLQDVENAQVKVRRVNGKITGIVMSAMVKNGEYPVNFDFTTICKKRQAFNAVIEKLAEESGEEVALTPDQLMDINVALRKEGVETACLGCFVESRRYNTQRYATAVCTKWNAAVDDYAREHGIDVDTIEDFDFAEGGEPTDEEYESAEKAFTTYEKTKAPKGSPRERFDLLLAKGKGTYVKHLKPNDIITSRGIEKIKRMSNRKHDFFGMLKQA